MEIPKPPEDAELVNIIDKLANFVARNGPEFEQMTKTKQKDNPKFSFLFGGEYYNYYQYKVSSEQARIQQQNQKLAQQQAIVQQVITQQAIQTAPWQQNKIIEQQSLALQQQQQTTALQQQITALQQQIAQQQATVAEQIKQSDSNLAAQYQSLTQQQQVQIEDAIVKERDNKLAALSRDCEVSMDELDKMVQPIIDSCTKDSIMHGKNWILAHCVSSDHCNLITQYLLKRICSKDAPFQTRLHLIYLTNDLLHHCQRKSIDGLKTALDKMVVPAFCKSSLGVDEESKQKLNKLLTLWEKNNYFDTETISQLKDPAASMATYQASLITEYGSIVTAITKQIQSQYASLEKQHQDFCAHLNNPIAQMQSQLQILMAKQRALPPPATGAIVPVGAPPPNVAAITAVNIPVSLQAPPVQLSETGNSGSGGGEPAEKTSTPETPASTQSESAHPSSDVTAPSKEGEGQQPQIPIQIPGTGPPQSINSIIPQGPPPGLPPGTQPPLGPAGNFTQPPPMPPFHTPPPGFGRPPPPQQFEYGHGLARGPPVMPPDFRGPPPGLPPGVPPLPLPDFSRPPPGFPAGPPPAPLGPPGPPPPGPHGPPGPIPPAPFPCLPTEIDLTPSVPYYDLPAGLMAPLVKLEDTEYQPLDPNDIRLPPPMPPSERLLAAVEAFYGPPSHDRPRDRHDGWEKLGLYEFFKAKQGAKRLKEKQVEEERLQNPSNSEQPLKLEPRSPVRNRSRSKSRSPPRRRRYASGDRKSRSRSRSRSKSKSPLPYLRRSRSPSPPVPNTLRAKSRSPTPPSFMPPTVPAVNQDESKLGEDNKGHMLLKKMGWGGKGLGVKEQGIENPIKAGEVRDRQDAFKGIGINLKDPFEQFRKSKSQGFIQRMKARDESREAKKAKSDD